MSEETEEILSHDPDAGERADAQEAELNRRMERIGHTPGPWAISPDEYHDDELTVTGGGDTGESVIATVWPIGDGSDEDVREQAANRLLIAASPQLLDSLKRLVSAVNHVQALSGPLGRDIVRDCYSVIAKAEGTARV